MQTRVVSVHGEGDGPMVLVEGESGTVVGVGFLFGVFIASNAFLKGVLSFSEIMQATR